MVSESANENNSIKHTKLALLQKSDVFEQELIDRRYKISDYFELSKEENEEAFVPIDIFNNDSLSALEAISKYLKEEFGLKYCEISRILNRNDRTIWGAYNNAKQKMDERFLLKRSNLQIPLRIFTERYLGVLEALSLYLKDNFNLKYIQIADMLNRDQRTIWTVHNRAIKKRIKRKNEKE